MLGVGVEVLRTARHTLGRGEVKTMNIKPNSALLMYIAEERWARRCWALVWGTEDGRA